MTLAFLAYCVLRAFDNTAENDPDGRDDDCCCGGTEESSLAWKISSRIMKALLAKKPSKWPGWMANRKLPLSTKNKFLQTAPKKTNFFF